MTSESVFIGRILQLPLPNWIQQKSEINEMTQRHTQNMKSNLKDKKDPWRTKNNWNNSNAQRLEKNNLYEKNLNARNLHTLLSDLKLVAERKAAVRTEYMAVFSTVQ